MYIFQFRKNSFSISLLQKDVTFYPLPTLKSALKKFRGKCIIGHWEIVQKSVANN